MLEGGNKGRRLPEGYLEKKIHYHLHLIYIEIIFLAYRLQHVLCIGQTHPKLPQYAAMMCKLLSMRLMPQLPEAFMRD